MEKILSKLLVDFPNITFSHGDDFVWSPKDQTVYYKDSKKPADIWSLLHETSHAILNHQNYSSDFELLKLELEAWETAKDLAKKYDLEISQDHIEHCLDTYRNWLHKRSLCPVCDTKSLEKKSGVYGCLNCDSEWKVTDNRMSRPYRRMATS